MRPVYEHFGGYPTGILPIKTIHKSLGAYLEPWDYKSTHIPFAPLVKHPNLFLSIKGPLFQFRII